MRKKAIGVLAGLFALTLCAAIPSVVSADAASTVSTGITMVKGASTRLDEPTGLKFKAEVTDTTATNYGVMIVPYDYFAAAEIALVDGTDYIAEFTAAVELELIPYAPIVVEGLSGESGYVEHSIVGLKDSNYNRPFFGVVFQNNGGTYEYAANNDNVRSVMEVASGALNRYYYHSEEWTTEEKAIFEGESATANVETLTNFVETGVANLAPWEYAIVTEATEVVAGSNVDLDINADLFAEWSSSDNTIATVDENGVVTGVRNGSVTITAKTKYGETEQTATKEISVTGTTATLVFDETLGLETNTEYTGSVVDGITVTTAKGGYSTLPKYNSGKHLKLYAGNSISFACAEGMKIVSVAVESVGTEKNSIVQEQCTIENAQKILIDVTTGAFAQFIPGTAVREMTLVNSHTAQIQLKAVYITYVETDEEIAPPEETPEPTYEEITIPQAIEIGNAGGSGDTKYYVTGTIVDIASTSAGNMTIADTDGNTLYIYNSYDSTGNTKYGSMTDKPVVGDTIKFLSVISTYNANPQLQNAWIMDRVDVTLSNIVKVMVVEASFDVPSDVSVDGEVIVNDKNYTDVEISWTSTNEAVAIGNGNVITFTRAAEATTVNLTATIKCGDNMKECDFTVNVASAATTSVTEGFVFSEYTAGTQYAENEEHVLNEKITVITTQCHFTSELRIYKTNGIAIFQCSNVIEKITMKIGNKSATVDLYGSIDGTTYTLIQAVSVTAAYADVSVSIDKTLGYKYLKFAGATAQVRMKEVSITYSAV